MGLLLVSVPTDFESDCVFDASDPVLDWHVRRGRSCALSHEVFPLPPERVEIIEQAGLMQAPDGNWPCYDNEHSPCCACS
jgi:hypothetical protein